MVMLDKLQCIQICRLIVVLSVISQKYISYILSFISYQFTVALKILLLVLQLHNKQF